MTLKVYVHAETMPCWVVYDNLVHITPLYQHGEHVGFQITEVDLNCHYVNIKRDHGKIIIWNVEL